MTTLVADLKAVLDPIFNGRVYRDVADAAGSDFPYVTILDDVSSVPGLTADGRSTSLSTLTQIDIWQNPEDDTIKPAVVNAIRQTRFERGSRRFRPRIYSTVRQPATPDNPIVHDAITIRVVSLL